MWSFLLQKARNKHFLSLAGNGIMSVLGMLTMVLLYRALSVSDIGLWIFFISTLTFVDTFRSGFLTTAFVKFYAGASKKRATQVVGSAWMIAICITGGLILLDGVAYLFIDAIPNPALRLLIQWFSLAFAASLPTFIATCVLQAEQRFDRLLILRLVTQGTYILSIAGLVLFNSATLQTILYAYVGSAVLASIFSLVTGWARLRSIAYRSTASIQELFHFGKYSVGTNLSTNMFGTSNTYIITFMLGAEALAVYNLGLRLMELVEIPLRSFVATGMPELAAAYNKGDKRGVIATMKRYTGLITIALIPVCILAVLFADMAIGIIGGSKYLETEAANILRILMLSALLYPLDRFLALTLDVIHQPRINFIKVLLMLASSVTGTFVGIYLTGSIYGVAVFAFIPGIIGISIGTWALNRYQSFDLQSVFQTGYADSMRLLQEYRLRLFHSKY